MASSTEFVDVDGAPVAYREAGEGPGPPLLLVHGFTGSKEDFDPVLDDLARDRRVVALDLPGHGESRGSDDPTAYGLSSAATWLLRAADALGLGEHHLLGHSMGGLIAQRVAAAASQRLHSLILMDTGVGAVREEVGDHLTRMATTAREEGMAAAFEVVRSAPRPHARPPAPELEQFLRERFLSLNPAAVVGGASSLITAMPLGAFLRGIDIPVLVIHGEHDDAWTAEEQILLARSVRGAELVVIPDSVHSPQRENPKAWLEAVTDFLERADRGKTAKRQRRD